MPNGEITAADVQSLSGPDELRRFLGTLGYDVSDPVEQTAASLSIAERVQHAISQAHRVAAERLSVLRSSFRKRASCSARSGGFSCLW